MAIITEETISYELFKEIILDVLQKLLGPEKEVTTNSVLKNNGISLEGIMVKNTSSGVTPTFYLETLYDMYKDGMTLDAIVDYILPFYEKEYSEDFFNHNIFGEYEKIKDNLFIKLINSEKNKSLLSNCPSQPFLDLSEVIYLAVTDENGCLGTVIVTKDLLKTWKKTFKTVYRSAKQNTYEKLGVSITSMYQFLIDLIDKKNLSTEYDEFISNHNALKENPGNANFPMYVMTNRNRHLGASCLIFNDIKEFSEKIDSDLYIIPSSIHEIILVPDQDEVSMGELSEVLNMVNSTELSSSEYLSDNIYYYSRSTGEISF